MHAFILAIKHEKYSILFHSATFEMDVCRKFLVSGGDISVYIDFEIKITIALHIQDSKAKLSIVLTREEFSFVADQLGFLLNLILNGEGVHCVVNTDWFGLSASASGILIRKRESSLNLNLEFLWSMQDSLQFIRTHIDLLASNSGDFKRVHEKVVVMLNALMPIIDLQMILNRCKSSGIYENIICNFESVFDAHQIYDVIAENIDFMKMCLGLANENPSILLKPLPNKQTDKKIGKSPPKWLQELYAIRCINNEN